ncbi:hypothetical protein SRB17_85760 [Streptomyces sp. RB17]|nr:hypothetical protein [Streptomyces sp. RB17]
MGLVAVQGCDAEDGPLVLLTLAHHQFEVAGLARQRLPHVHLVVAGVGELELLQHQRQGQLGLGERELPADAGTPAVAERLVGVLVVLGAVLRQPPVDVELLGAVPRLGVRVERPHQQVHLRARLEFVLAADDGVLDRGLHDLRDGSPEAQGLLQDPRDHVHLHDGVVVRHRVARQHPVHLGVGLGQHVRVAHQRVGGERQQTAGGLVAGDQEGHDLVADVVVVQRLAGLRVGGLQHQAQQVVLTAGLPLTALLDHIFDQVPHQLDVLVVPLVVVHPQRGHRRQLLRAPHRLGQRLEDRVEEGVQLLLVEGIEPVAEPGQGDGVQGEPGVVVGDLDRLALLALPLADQVLGDLQHLAEVALHGPLAERRHEDPVRHAPDLFVVGGREQAGAGVVPDVSQRREDRLPETGLVGDLGDQVRVVDEDVLLAGEVHAVDALGELLGLLGEVRHRVGVGYLRLAQDRDPVRGPDGAKVVRGVRGHVLLLCVEGWARARCAGRCRGALQKHTPYGIETIRSTESE